jgi:geranylgeranyl diphosphate synthase, type I
MPGDTDSSRALAGFSGDFVPQIDSFLAAFYRERIESSDYPFMKDLYCELGKYAAREGKRIRPLLVILGYLGYGGKKSAAGETVKFASAVELMHSMLLVQDDIIDRSPLRRGEKSLHVVFSEKYRGLTGNDGLGSDIALVMADVMFSNALRIISSARTGNRSRERFIRIFADTYERTAFGQVLDSLNSLPVSIEPMNGVPRLIGTMKTAYYTVYYPLLMGCSLAGKDSDSEKERIRDFALPLGLAFQVRDDILGMFGNDRDTGKPSDSDIREGKLTQLVQGASDSLQGAERERFIAAFTAREKSGADIEYIRAMVRESGALDRARLTHSELVARAEALAARLRFRRACVPVLNGVIGMVRDI